MTDEKTQPQTIEEAQAAIPDQTDEELLDIWTAIQSDPERLKEIVGDKAGGKFILALGLELSDRKLLETTRPSTPKVDKLQEIMQMASNHGGQNRKQRRAAKSGKKGKSQHTMSGVNNSKRN